MDLGKKTNLRVICLILGLCAFVFYFDPVLCLLSFVYAWLCAGIFIEIFMHTYVSHKLYEFKSKFLRNTFYFLTATIFPEVCPVVWSALHRAHHIHVNTVDDPHHANSAECITFYQALKGLYAFPSDWQELTKDLINDPFVLFCSKWREVFFICWLLILASIDIKYMLWFGIMPVNFNQIFIAVVNTAFHKNAQTVNREGLLWGIWSWGVNMHIKHHKTLSMPTWPLHKLIVGLISKKK